jgi:ketosteroid isomerase-like protein
MNNKEVIHRFYTAFQNKDYRSMQDCYSDRASFSDPVFKDLNAVQVKAMWEMFCVKSRDLTVVFKNIEAGEESGSAAWTASYTFSATGKKVTNHIAAHFVFENGKIAAHTDHFNFYKWASQALGAKGILLGWTKWVQKKVQTNGLKALNTFINKKQINAS